MKNLVTAKMEETNRLTQKEGIYNALLSIGIKYRYAVDPADKTAWHIVIRSIKTRFPQYSGWLPGLPETN